jgi:hypothetical protein
MQQAIHRGFAGHVLTGVGQTGHDLAGRQIFESVTVENPHGGIALNKTEFVGRHDLGAQLVYTAVSSAPAGTKPTLHGS